MKLTILLDCSPLIFYAFHRQDDEIAALWQTLHERGFCSRSPTESPDGTLALSTLGPGDQPLTEAKTNSDPSGKPESQEMSRLQVGVRPNIDSSAGDDDDERGGESCDGRRGEDQQGLQAQPKIDAILHSVAHAPTESMQEGFVTVRRDGHMERALELRICCSKRLDPPHV